MEENNDNTLAETVEEVAGEQLGVNRWNRPEVFRQTAEAATANDLPYWLLLVLSGAIATLGLALNSSAVVIGAMLVAPLLAPVIGLALALAVGDGRLAVQTVAVVLGSTLAVILTSVVLTLLLPFHTVTAEISARTRPTTLDLAIAIFSGLVGAVVTVARGSRLSAAVPGVAISVALIPPLGVAGFGIGVGWDWTLIRGSLLLYGANLAGIVLSGMAVLLLVGIHGAGVLEVAQRWHREGVPHGLAAWADRAAWVRSLGVFRSVWARVGLVVGFVVALAVPLSATLEQLVRETRVERAIAGTAEDIFEVSGHSSVLGRQVSLGTRRTRVVLRVATTEPFGQRAREAFERRASARASEPVHLTLEQVVTTAGDVEELAEALPLEERAPAPAPPQTAIHLSELLATTRDRLAAAARSLALPAGVSVAGLELATTTAGSAILRIAYAAPEPLPAQARQMLRQQLSRALDLPELRIALTHVSTAPRPAGGAAPDTASLLEVAALLHAYEGLSAELIAAEEVDSASVQAAVRWLAGRGIEPRRVALRRGPGAGLRVRVRNGPASPQAERPLPELGG